MDNFSVGDKVSCYSAYGRTPYAVSTIEKVGGRKIKLANGSEWKADGWGKWGESSKWGRSRIVQWKPEHDEQMLHERLCTTVNNFGDWSRLNTSRLTAIVSIIEAHRAENNVG